MGNVDRDCNESGSVLILTLGILALLFCVGVSVSWNARIGFALNNGAWDRIRLVQDIKAAALHTPALKPGDPWGDHGETVEVLPAAAEETDEASRINLNTAPPELLRALFQGDGALAETILHRRAQAPLKSVEELTLVPGVTPEVYEDLERIVTVYTEGAVNINTASERVLQLMGVPADLSGRLSQAKDSVHWKDAAAVNAALSTAGMASKDLASLRRGLQSGRFVFNSNVRRLRLRGKRGTSVLNVEVVVATRADRPHILAWREALP